MQGDTLNCKQSMGTVELTQTKLMTANGTVVISRSSQLRCQPPVLTSVRTARAASIITPPIAYCLLPLPLLQLLLQDEAAAYLCGLPLLAQMSGITDRARPACVLNMLIYL